MLARGMSEKTETERERERDRALSVCLLYWFASFFLFASCFSKQVLLAKCFAPNAQIQKKKLEKVVTAKFKKHPA